VCPERITGAPFRTLPNALLEREDQRTAAPEALRSHFANISAFACVLHFLGTAFAKQKAETL
jgi:hypothetical protein